MTASEEAVARLLATGTIARPGTPSALTSHEWSSLPRTSDGVVCLLREGVDTYRASIGADWDCDLSSPELSNFAKRYLSHYTPLCVAPQSEFRQSIAALARSHLPQTISVGLEWGCSVGPDTFAFAECAETLVACDSYLPALRWLQQRLTGRPVPVYRRLGGNRFTIETELRSDEPPRNVVPLLCNALDPPSLPYAVDAVFAVNVLDNVSHPLTLLGQAHAVLKPGGLLLLATPFHWNDAITPNDQQFSTLYPNDDGPSATRRILRGGDARMAQLDFQILEECELPWTLVDHARCSVHYRVWVVVARRQSTA